jgi:hypothetical protein
MSVNKLKTFFYLRMSNVLNIHLSFILTLLQFLGLDYMDSVKQMSFDVAIPDMAQVLRPTPSRLLTCKCK